MTMCQDGGSAKSTTKALADSSATGAYRRAPRNPGREDLAAHSASLRRPLLPARLCADAPADLRFRSGVSFDGNRLTGLELSKRRVKIGLTTIYLEGRETLSASRMRCCCWSGMGNFVTTILSSTL